MDVTRYMDLAFPTADHVAVLAQGVVGLLKNHPARVIAISARAAAQVMMPWQDPQGTRSKTIPIWNPETHDWNFPWLTEDNDVQWVSCNLWVLRYIDCYPGHDLDSGHGVLRPRERPNDAVYALARIMQLIEMHDECVVQTGDFLARVEVMSSVATALRRWGVVGIAPTAAPTTAAPAHGSAAAAARPQLEPQQQQQRRSATSRRVSVACNCWRRAETGDAIREVPRLPPCAENTHALRS